MNLETKEIIKDLYSTAVSSGLGDEFLENLPLRPEDLEELKEYLNVKVDY